MTYAEVETQVKQLSHEEKLLLMQAIMHWLLEESSRAASLKRAQTHYKPKRPAPPASVLRGIARPNGPMPTDEELKRDYVNYLDRKYA